MINYIQMSKERSSAIQAKLSESNKILENYYSKISGLSKAGLRLVGGKKFNKMNFVNKIIEESKKSPNSSIFVANLTIEKEDVEKIVFAKTLEEEIISSFSRMFYKIANKWTRINKDICLSVEDLESEAIQAALVAMYGYTDTDYAISTYLYKCVSNKIRNLCNRTSQLSNLGSNAISIKRKYEEAKAKFEGSKNFYEIVNSLNLNEKETRILKSTFSKVLNCSDLSSEEKVNPLDYTSLGKKFSGIGGELEYSCVSNGNNFTIRNIESNDKTIDLNLEEFTELEKIVLEGFMTSNNNLGIGSLAKKLVNPKTGKPYSRMAITYAWRRVKDKIKKYSKVA
jgi:RNA polymerase sigma factor (sigma-70 family)